MTQQKPTGNAPRFPRFYEGVARFKANHSLRAIALKLGYSESDYDNRLKKRFNPAQPESKIFVDEMIAFTKETGDFSMIDGLCKEVGLSTPMPFNYNANANLNTEFLVATKALGEVAEHLNVSKLSPNGVTKLTASLHTLVASALTIGYAAESRFGGISMSMMFGDLASGTLI